MKTRKGETVSVHCKHDFLHPIDKMVVHPRNPNKHPAVQIKALAKIILSQGWRAPIVVSKRSGLIVAGHARLEAAQSLGLDLVPVDEQEFKTEQDELAHLVADNRIAELANIELSDLTDILSRLKDDDFDIELAGFTDEDLASTMGRLYRKDADFLSLADKFLIPPFSILDARQGAWSRRKAAWLSLGIESEKGRKKLGTNASGATFKNSYASRSKKLLVQTSIFDPVLCELAFRWFCPPGGLIVDPFCGGSVRGIVASHLGRDYIGVDLRGEQVEANKSQLHLAKERKPVWLQGDSTRFRSILNGSPDVNRRVKADFLFSCPPYADLEVYSKDPRDISNMNYEDFKPAYFKIIAEACSKLKNNRFAGFVVSEVRNKYGNYYCFVSDTIAAFKAAGLEFYNEAILVTATGTVPLTTSRNFPVARKLGRTHQNVLFFLKGDAKKATEACGDVAVKEWIDLFLERVQTEDSADDETDI